MASFEERSLLDPIRVFRPKAHDAKAWWRYAILAERYKVRCAQREELWLKAGASNMNILAHIRSLIKKHGSFDGVNLDDANGDFVEEEDSTKKLHPLELVVDDLNRENMALRKMIKTLLTPLARESFVAEEMSIEDLDKQISVFEEFAAKTSVAASPSPRSQHNSPLRLGGQMEDEADDQLVASLANCVDSPNINLHSPYENLLPPIALTDKDINGPKSARNSRASIRNSPQKPAQDKFPSYLEREAMRRETIAKKRQETIMRKADQLLRASIIDSSTTTTTSSYLPAIHSRTTELSAQEASENAEQPSERAVEDSMPSSSGVITADAESHHHDHHPAHHTHNASHHIRRNFEPEGLEQPSIISVDASTNDVSAPMSVYARNKAAAVASAKAAKQDTWCEDYRIVDKTIGRGKGKPREPSEPSPKQVKAARKQEKPERQSDDRNKQPISSKVRDPKSDTEEHSSPMPRAAFPEPHSEMTEAEKMTVKAISKARGKHRSAEETKKPLTNLEMMLMKSPLALPVMKLPPNAVPMISPREKALRSKVSPRVQSFIYPQRASPRPQALTVAGAEAVKTTTEGTTGTEPAASQGNGTGEDGGDGGREVVTASDVTHSPKPTTDSSARDIAEEVHVPEALELLDTAENSIVEDAGTHDSSVVLDPPLFYPDSPNLNLQSGNNSISSPPSPKRKISPRAEPNYLKAPQRHSPRGGSTDPAHALNTTQKPVKSTDSSRTPSPRGKFEQTQPTKQRSPLRSPRQDPYLAKANTAKTNPRHKNAAHKHHLDETLTSHSAPGTVATAKPHKTAAAAGENSANMNLIMDIDGDVADSASAPVSPGRRTEDEKIKKKSVLKNLNEKSNPSSPRDKISQDASPAYGFDNADLKMSEDLLTAAEVSSATVGETSPAKDF